MDLGGVLSYSFIKECRFGGVSGCFAVVSRRSRSDHLDSDRLSDGVTGFEAPGVEEDDDDVEMVKEEEGEDGGLAGVQEDDMLLTQLSGFQTQDSDEGDALETQEQEQERRIKPRVRAVFVAFIFCNCFEYLNPFNLELSFTIYCHSSG